MVDRWWRWFILVGAALCGLAVLYAILTPSPGDTERYVVPEQYRENLKNLDRQAIEKAYIQQVTRLFEQWMRDHTDQPDRALRGVDLAKRTYVESMTAVDKR
jgi:hypothetical protein